MLGCDDGFAEGCEDGVLSGCALGLQDGCVVGRSDGWLDGLPLGIELGWQDGCDVGSAEWTSGSNMHKTSNCQNACFNHPSGLILFLVPIMEHERCYG